MIPIVILFWLFVTIVAVCMTWSNYLARLASEKTIRLAIDKGLILDPSVIDQLRPVHRPRWDLRLIVLGIIVAFVGAGIAAFAVLLGLDSPDAFFPVMAIASIPLMGGAGLLVAGFWLRRSRFD